MTNRHARIGFLAIAAMLWFWPVSGSAFDPSTDHVCVANCGGSATSSSSSSSGSRSGAVPNPALNALGTMSYGIGNAVGSAIRNGMSNDRTPDSGQTEDARRYLDEWEKDSPDAAASDNYDQGIPPDHGGLRVVNAPQSNQPNAGDDKSLNTTIRVINKTTSYITVSVDGSYGCNTAGGTTCLIPVLKGHHMLRAVRTDSGATFSQSVNVPSPGLTWPLVGN